MLEDTFLLGAAYFRMESAAFITGASRVKFLIGQEFEKKKVAFLTF